MSIDKIAYPTCFEVKVKKNIDRVTFYVFQWFKKDMNMINFEEIRPIIKKIENIRQNEPDINEVNTIQSIISPMMRKIGWDTDNHYEFNRGYKQKKVDGETDITILIEGKPILTVECRRLSDLRKKRDADQSLEYIENRRIEWGVLTNGVSWELWRINSASDSEEKVFFEFNLIEDDEETVTRGLNAISKTGWVRGEIKDLWKERNTRGAVLNYLQDIEKDSAILSLMAEQVEGCKVSEEDLKSVFREMNFSSMVNSLKNKSVKEESSLQSSKYVKVKDLENAGILKEGDELCLKDYPMTKCIYVSGGKVNHNGQLITPNSWVRIQKGGKRGYDIMRYLMKDGKILDDYRKEYGL